MRPLRWLQRRSPCAARRPACRRTSSPSGRRGLLGDRRHDVHRRRERVVDLAALSGRAASRRTGTPATCAKLLLATGRRDPSARCAAVVGERGSPAPCPTGPLASSASICVAEQAVREAHHQEVALPGEVEQEAGSAPVWSLRPGIVGPSTTYWLPSGRKRHGTCGMTLWTIHRPGLRRRASSCARRRGRRARAGRGGRRRRRGSAPRRRLAAASRRRRGVLLDAPRRGRCRRRRRAKSSQSRSIGGRSSARSSGSRIRPSTISRSARARQPLLLARLVGCARAQRLGADVGDRLLVVDVVGAAEQRVEVARVLARGRQLGLRAQAGEDRRHRDVGAVGDAGGVAVPGRRLGQRGEVRVALGVDRLVGLHQATSSGARRRSGRRRGCAVAAPAARTAACDRCSRSGRRRP